MNKRDLISAIDEELVVMDSYDDCIIGICERFGQDSIVAYDLEKILLKLEAKGMSRDEAEEFFYYNQIGAWVGDRTPCFIRFIQDEKWDVSQA